jgi:hypothetical protein
MRTWILLFSSTRIRTAPQFPQVYSTVGVRASSTGGALPTAFVAAAEALLDRGWGAVRMGFKPRWRSRMLEHDIGEPFGLVDHDVVMGIVSHIRSP